MFLVLDYECNNILYSEDDISMLFKRHQVNTGDVDTVLQCAIRFYKYYSRKRDHTLIKGGMIILFISNNE